MSNSIIPFNFGAVEVRASLDEAGNPWFVAADVCRVLGIRNTAHAIASLDDDEKSSIVINDRTSKGGNPNKSIINEFGLYSLVQRSRKAEAKTFRRWINHEVLPAIRKTGGYSATQAQSFSADVIALMEYIVAMKGSSETAMELLQQLTPKGNRGDMGDGDKPKLGFRGPCWVAGNSRIKDAKHISKLLGRWVQLTLDLRHATGSLSIS